MAQKHARNIGSLHLGYSVSQRLTEYQMEISGETEKQTELGREDKMLMC